MWFVYDIQNLIFGKSKITFKPPEIVSKLPSDKVETLNYDITKLLNSTPLEIHKTILKSLNKQSMTKKQLKTLLTTYTKSEFNKGFNQLRKKRYIYFNSKTDTWDINKSKNIEK